MHPKGTREELDALLEWAWEGQRKRQKWAETHPPMPDIIPAKPVPPRFYDSPLWWGVFSLAATVVIGYLSQSRWMLFLDIIPLGWCWWFACKNLNRLQKIVIFSSLMVVTAGGLLVEYLFLGPLNPLEIAIRPIVGNHVYPVIFDITNGPDELDSADFICVDNQVTDANGNLYMNNHALSEFVPKFKPGKRYMRICPWSYGGSVPLAVVKVEFRLEFSTTSTNQKFFDAKYHLETDAFNRHWWIRDSLEQGDAPRTIPQK